MVLGWGTAERDEGVDPYAKYDTYKTTPEGQRYRGNRPGFDWGDVGSFITDDLLGFDDWARAGEAWRQGDVGQLAKSVGTGLYELGTTIAAPFTGGTSLLARAATGSGANVVAPLALGIAAGAGGWQPAAQVRAQQERSAMELARQQAERDRVARSQQNAANAAARWSNDPFLQFQPGMTSSFSKQGIQQAGQAVQQAGQAVQQAQQDANRFSQALGLNPAQTEQFQRALNQAELDRDRLLGNLESQERQNRRITQQAARGTRARGAGSMADLQQAAAARGLMASPASYDVGRGQIGANVAAEQAQQQASLADFLSQVESARGQVTSDYRQQLDEIARQRLAAELQNENDAITRLLSRFQQ